MMFYRLLKNTVFIIAITSVSCIAKNNLQEKKQKISQEKKKIVLGANQTEAYFPILSGKRVAVVGNQTSVIFKKEDTSTHLVDSLVASAINVEKVFSPEHGFRGNADAGELVKNGVDTQTGIPIVSLYGNHKKPTSEDLEGIDILVFDIQDVGVRFYTYISTLHYVMEACAENNIPILILDRPNPNGHYIDGPLLEKKHQSFVGMHPVPIVHGMTIGEYACMINGQQWLKNNIQCELKIIPVKNYQKSTNYSLPIKPSPNLPNDKSINLYPSLCFFEGTNVNAGRGTEKQFQVFGSPFLDKTKFDYHYTPAPNEGAKHPKHEGMLCFGKDLSNTQTFAEINLSWLIKAYKNTEDKEAFFTTYFTKLAGTEKLQKQLENEQSETEIKASWKKGLQAYQNMRKPYLLY